MRWRARASLARVRAQDRRDHLLHRGLAVAAGDRDERQAKARAPVARELAERELRVVDDDQPAADTRPGSAGRPAPPAAPRACACGEEVVGVEALAAQRDEQVARAADCACRSTRPRSARRRRSRGRRATCGGLGERVIMRRASLARAPRAPRPASENGRRRPRSPGSSRGPCRRCSTTSLGAASRDRRRDGARADRPRRSRVAASRRPRSASMIARGILAARVVAGDDHAVGEPRGDRAHQRPLASDRGRRRSRTRTTSLPPRSRASGRSASQHLLERVGRVRVVDDHERLRPPTCSMRPGTGGRSRDAARTASASGDAVGEQAAEHAEHVRHVEVADLAASRACARPSVESSVHAPRRGAMHVDRPAVAPRAKRCSRSCARRARAGAARARTPIASSRLSTALRRPGQCEQPRLGLAVGLHRAVVVEVVVREVGEQRAVEARRR